MGEGGPDGSPSFSQQWVEHSAVGMDIDGDSPTHFNLVNPFKYLNPFRSRSKNSDLAKEDLEAGGDVGGTSIRRRHSSGSGLFGDNSPSQQDVGRKRGTGNMPSFLFGFSKCVVI